MYYYYYYYYNNNNNNTNNNDKVVDPGGECQRRDQSPRRHAGLAGSA